MGLLSILKDATRTTTAKDEERGLVTAGRARSEFFAAGQQARFEEAHLPSDDEGGEATLPTHLVRSAAKSFTATALRRPAPPAAVPEARAASTPAGPSPYSVEYSSVGQFSQRIELYRGSISTVYRGTCTASRQPVIIKAYTKAKMKPKNFLRLEREIKLMRFLAKDPSIVQLYGVFEDTGHKYLIMEVCEGGDLFKAMMLKGGKMPEKWVCVEMLVPLLQSLTRLHAHSILHRDIKPENIFLTAAQRFKLGDFGLAINAAEEQPFTRSGTLDYMAPEVLGNPTTELQESPQITRASLKTHGVRPYDEKVDVWAAGVLAYELTVGRPPFEVNDEARTASLIMYSNDLHYPSRYSPLWADFVKQALQKNPAQRPSAAQLLEHAWVRFHMQGVQSVAAAPLTAVETVSMSAAPPLPALRHSMSLIGPAKPPTEALFEPRPLASEKSTAARTPSGNLSAGLRPATPPALAPRPQKSALKAGNSFSLLPAIQALSTQDAASSGVGDKPSRMHSGELGFSGGSFTALLAKAHPHGIGYVDSGEVPDAEERARGGMRVRVKHYFNRQKGSPLASST